MEAGLYVVATPIGNLADFSARAVAVLKDVDLIAAEDTRHTRRLLDAYDISTTIVAYHEHSDPRAAESILARLAEGNSVALVSDAGTPLISDPGYRLVRAAQDQGLPVRAVPGACAVTTALSVSGLPTDRFLFEGFLPARAAARGTRLAELAAESATLVFYEAPHRVAECLAQMAAVLGAEREAALARELTKTFETVRRGRLAELADWVSADADQQRGEIVLLVAGNRERDTAISAPVSTLLQRLARELPARQAAVVVADWSGLRARQLYDHLLSLKDAPDE